MDISTLTGTTPLSQAFTLTAPFAGTGIANGDTVWLRFWDGPDDGNLDTFDEPIIDGLTLTTVVPEPAALGALAPGAAAAGPSPRPALRRAAHLWCRRLACIGTKPICGAGVPPASGPNPFVVQASRLHRDQKAGGTPAPQRRATPCHLSSACVFVARLSRPRGRLEGLERRLLLAHDPVIELRFNEPEGSTTVTDSAAAGGVLTGTLAGTVTPEIRSTDPSPAGGNYVHFDGDGRTSATADAWT